MTTVRQAASVSLVLWLRGSILDLAADEACEGWISEAEVLQQDFFCPLVFFFSGSPVKVRLAFHMRESSGGHTQKSAPVLGLAALRERSDLQVFGEKKKKKNEKPGFHSGWPCQTPDAAVTPCGYSLDHIIQFNTALLGLTEKYQH